MFHKDIKPCYIRIRISSLCPKGTVKIQSKKLQQDSDPSGTISDIFCPTFLVLSIKTLLLHIRKMSLCTGLVFWQQGTGHMPKISLNLIFKVCLGQTGGLKILFIQVAAKKIVTNEIPSFGDYLKYLRHFWFLIFSRFTQKIIIVKLQS